MKTTRRANLYSVFIMIVVIFVTIFYIQFATDINSVIGKTNLEAFRLLNALSSSRTHSAVLPRSDDDQRETTETTLRSAIQTVNESKNTLETINNQWDSDKKHPDIHINIKNVSYMVQRNITFVKNLTNDTFIDDNNNSLKNESQVLINGSVSTFDNLLNGSFLSNYSGKYIIKEVFNDTLLKTMDHKTLKNGKRPIYCPLWPMELDGRMPEESFLNDTDIVEPYLSRIQNGGKFKPRECEPRERTAIIIPYRDRENNLRVLLRHLHMILQRQKIEYGIYIVEMAYPAQFNRGLLANIGFLTASSIAPYTCYVIHDVDLLMLDDRNMYRCGRVPRHLTATNTKFGTRLPYLSYFGGIEAFTPDQFWKVNGFSNLYFGQGGEDDDMVARIFQTGMHFSRPKPLIGGYVAIHHDKEPTVPKNPHRESLLKTAAQRMFNDGVKSVSYYRLALEFKQLYTWVYIGVKEAKIMEKFQDYMSE